MSHDWVEPVNHFLFDREKLGFIQKLAEYVTCRHLQVVNLISSEALKVSVYLWAGRNVKRGTGDKFLLKGFMEVSCSSQTWKLCFVIHVRSY